MLVGVFFISTSDQHMIVIALVDAPVVFSRMAFAGAGTSCGKKGPARVTAKATKGSSLKNSQTFKSVYPTSSLKDRPKKVSNATVPQAAPEVPLFSPISKKKKMPSIKEAVPVKEIKPDVTETQEIITQKSDEQMAVQDEPISVGEIAAGTYDPLYSSLIQQWVLPQGIKKGLLCRVRITVHPDGTSTYDFLKKSGVLAFDTAVRSAVMHARYPQTIKSYTKTVEFRS